jgi:hypothetical protein
MSFWRLRRVLLVPQGYCMNQQNQQPRHCPRCRGPVAWYRDRPPGARCSVARCLVCGGCVTRKAPTQPKRSRVRKRRPTEYDELKAEADKLCRAYVMARDGNRCVICGSTKVVQWAHVLSRRYHPVRCDPDNSVALCRAHHCYYTYRKEEWREWCEERLGPELWRSLNMRRGARWRTDDWRLTIIDLQNRLERVAETTVSLSAVPAVR